MDKILITGCCGTTGTALVKYLIDNTDSIIYGVDNFYKEGSEDNYRELCKYASTDRFQFKQLDISDYSKFYEWLSYIKLNTLSFCPFDKVYNLAAIVETPRFYDSPYETHEVNCNAAIRLYKWCTQNGVKKFVNASSSEIYGHATEFPTKETTPQHYDSVEISPRWSYAHGKILNEYIMNQIYNENPERNTKVCHLRYANVYGENDINPVHVIPYFVNKMLLGEDVHANSKPLEFRRTFLHNDDSTLGTYLAMENMVSTHAYNIGSQEEVSIKELLDICVEEIFDVTHKPIESKFIYDIERPGDPVRRKLDTTRAKEELGFECKVSLREGIRRVVESSYNQLKKEGKL